MKKITVLGLSTVVLAGMCWGQNSESVQATTSASQSTQVSADKSGAQASSKTDANASQKGSASGKNGQVSAANQLKGGSTVQAELTKPVDVRKNKPGDEVIAKTMQDVKSDGRVVLPKGSKIVGRVTQAQARGKGQEESQLGMSFDHAILRDGTRMPVAFTIQAISRSEAAAAADTDSLSAGGNAGGMTSAAGNGGMQNRGGLGGLTSTAGGVVNTAGSTAGATLNTAGNPGAGVTGSLGATSQGVVGLPGMTLSSATSSATGAGSVISSKDSNVRLDSGTRMILSVTK